MSAHTKHKRLDKPVSKHLKQPQKLKQQLLISAQPLWHAPDLIEELAVEDSAAYTEISADAKAELLTQSLVALEAENEIYSTQSTDSSSQRQFFSEIASAGTLSDRISALTLVIQESPLHTTRSLTGLMALAKKKNRTAALQAVAALKDLFGAGNVLPDRKLIWFAHRDPTALSLLYSVVVKHAAQVDGKTARLAKQTAVLWAFEDWVKQLYFTFVQLLEQLSHDSIVHVRTSVLGDIVDLIRDKPEQEVNLLRLAVNKLGDADRRVASRASHLMLTLEQAHPAMKRVVVNAISELLFRPGADYHARYYSMITLNQTIVTSRDKDLASALIEIYFNVFEKLMAETKTAREGKVQEKNLKKKGRWKAKNQPQKSQSPKQQAIKQSPEALEEANTRLVSAILTGLNRAFPYSSLDESVFNSHLSVIYTVARSGNFNARVQALMLLFQIATASDAHADRFYRTLYESLLDPRVIISSKQALFLNLVYKAMKADTKPERVKAFAKRLVQVAAETLNIGFCAGVMYLLSEVSMLSVLMRELYLK